MTEEIFLGLDLATAHARLVAVADSGCVLAQRTLPLPTPAAPAPGRAEQPADYLAAARRLLHEITGELGSRAAAIRALSTTGTSGTIVPCGADGRPVGPAILYHDQRAAAEAKRLAANGFPATSTSPLARIGWLCAHEPAARYLHTPDVVAAGLLGAVPPTDTSHALKAGIDPVAARWNEPALDALDIPRTALPDLVHPGTPLGVLANSLAAELGLPPGVVLIAGMTDGCTAQIGSGAVNLGDTVGVLGTTLVLKAVTEQPVSGHGGAVYSHLAPDGRFWPGGASNVGAGLIRTEFPGADLAELDAGAERAGPASSVRYPLPGKGERFPFSHPDATGFRLGGASTRGQDFRALLEGAAFAERLGLDALRALGVRTRSHRVAGGASASRLWNRIRASVLDRPVVKPSHPTSDFGAAVLAFSASTGTPLSAAAARFASTAETIEPDPSETGPLRENYERLREELRRRGYLDTAQAAR